MTEKELRNSIEEYIKDNNPFYPSDRKWRQEDIVKAITHGYELADIEIYRDILLRIRANIRNGSPDPESDENYNLIVDTLNGIKPRAGNDNNR